VNAPLLVLSALVAGALLPTLQQYADPPYFYVFLMFACPCRQKHSLAAARHSYSCLWEDSLDQTQSRRPPGHPRPLGAQDSLAGAHAGYGITLHIQRVSNDILRVEEGSLYPALHRMEQDGWIRAEWGVSENNRRARYYSLAAGGHKQLQAEVENWARLTAAVTSVLQCAD